MKFCVSIFPTIWPKSSTLNSAPASAEQKADFCAGLRLEELALARACAAGNERAWQDFISRYRQKLHSMRCTLRATAPCRGVGPIRYLRICMA